MSAAGASARNDSYIRQNHRSGIGPVENPSESFIFLFFFIFLIFFIIHRAPWLSQAWLDLAGAMPIETYKHPSAPTAIL